MDDGAAELRAPTGERTAARLLRWWRSVPVLAADALLAAVVLVVSLLEITLDHDTGPERPLQAVVLVAMSVVIVFRRRAPVAVWVVSGVLATIYGIGSWNDPTLPYGPLISVYTVAALTDTRTAVRALAITLACIVGALLVDQNDDLLDWLVALLSTSTAWLIGNNVRTQRAYADEMEARAARLERDRLVDADRAVAEERLRIARELHDVAAHHVSVIALHAEAGQSLLPDQPVRADQSFAIIGQVARTTLTELRRVVGVLREDASAPLTPQPGLRQLSTLVDEVQQAGVPVTLHVTGEPRPIGDAVDASAYRIVQEALTNVLRHAGPASAEVNVTYSDDAVAVEVLDDGRGPSAGAGTDGSGSGGHGLVGMRERAAAFGGSLTTSERPGGGFVVLARLPA